MEAASLLSLCMANHCQPPLVIASGAIRIFTVCLLHLGSWFFGKKILSGGLVIILVVLLYREIKTIGKISVVLWLTVTTTIAWIIAGGMTYQYPVANWFSSSIEFPELSSLFFVALGHASVKTVYSYLGYYNVCHIGGEIRNPESNIPKSIFISIAGYHSLSSSQPQHHESNSMAGSATFGIHCK
jgi:amino acid transporter